jgi:hypothetical protein
MLLRKSLNSFILISRMKNFHFKIIIIFVALTAALAGCRGSAQDKGALEKAAIIDQLYLLGPNQPFINNATRLLESYGYTVDLWQGSEVTVDFYRKLPEMGYKLIIFRVHSGLLKSLNDKDTKAQEITYLFTAEKYSTVKYIKDQLTDKVSNAMMTEKLPLVFAVNPAFIKSAGGRFDNTAVILMGCESYSTDDMPAAFIEKGASAYIGWSTVVSLEYVDKAALDLLGNLCVANMPLAEAIETTMATRGSDPHFNAYLKYYPPGSANQTVRDLTRGN